jgi:hypothetical protein
VMLVFKSKMFQNGSLFLAMAVIPALGQTTGTCSTAPTSITNFNIERSLNLGLTSGSSAGSQVGLFTTLTPALSPAVVAAVLTGAVEAREQFSLNTTSNVLSIQGFTAAPGSPSPTPAQNINSLAVLYIYQVQVDKIYFSCKPVPSVLMTGTIINNFPNTPFGNANGALVAVGFGYTTDNPPKLNNVTILVPGVAGLYSAAAVGTLTLPSASVNPPGTANTNPTVVFTPAATQTVFQKQIQLDASKSTDPNGLQLTYVWTQLNSNIAAGISNGNTATPLVTFAGGKGDYTFQVIVTNSKGGSSTAQTTISYYGQ